jgi:glycosyltransferase involved in cell wall biosynthesis
VLARPDAVPAGPPPGLLRLLVVFHEPESLGAGRSVLRALEPLAAYGWSAAAWLPGEGPLLEEAQAVAVRCAHREKPLAYSVRGWRSHPGVAARVRTAPSYLSAFRRELLVLRPHVVHANTLRTLPEATAARSLGLPVVLHVHELPAGRKGALAVRWAARVAHVLVCVSEATAALVRPHAGSTPVLVVRNGVPFEDVRREESEPPVVGTVGTVCRAKGTDLFLEAAALALERCPELRFEHFGQTGLDDDGELAERVAALAASPGLHDAVALLGRRPAAEGLRRWELFVSASREDAFPLAVLEAMAAGVPVVATGVGGVPEQVDHLETGILVPPGQPAALADWIVKLHRDPGLRARLGTAAARRVRERFDVGRQADGLHEAYLAALNLRHGPPFVRRATVAALRRKRKAKEAA